MGGEPSALASVALRDNTARGYGAALATPARSIVAAHDNTTEEVSGTAAFRAPVVVTAYDYHGAVASVDGRRVHWARTFRGERFSLIWYTTE